MSDNKTTTEQSGFPALAKKFLWADSASSVERVIFWLGVLCAILFVLDFIVHRHAYAPGEGLPGFYAFVGFCAFAIIVLGAAQLRKVILRNEAYYSPNSVDSEPYPEEGLERHIHVPEADTSPALSTDQKTPTQNGHGKGDST